MMVEELMIAAGEVAARFAKAKGLTIPFKTQKRPSDDEAYFAYLMKGKEKSLLIKHWNCLSRLPPSVLSITPDPHFSLGLDCYAQVTIIPFSFSFFFLLSSLRQPRL